MWLVSSSYPFTNMAFKRGATDYPVDVPVAKDVDYAALRRAAQEVWTRLAKRFLLQERKKKVPRDAKEFVEFTEKGHTNIQLV